jgi:hypothetical protein
MENPPYRQYLLGVTDQKEVSVPVVDGEYGYFEV